MALQLQGSPAVDALYLHPGHEVWQRLEDEPCPSADARHVSTSHVSTSHVSRGTSAGLAAGAGREPTAAAGTPYGGTADVAGAPFFIVGAGKAAELQGKAGGGARRRQAGARAGPVHVFAQPSSHSRAT